MIKAVPFINTSRSEKFKEFLTLPFTIDMLYPIFNDKSSETLFDGWKGKDMINWYKFINDDKIVLEFYSNYYIIWVDKTKYMVSIPKTINEFINDINKFNIQLYWTTWIDLHFEPKDYLQVSEIKDYYINLLSKMGKSHELL